MLEMLEEGRRKLVKDAGKRLKVDLPRKTADGG
jgi:hypothetical protein